MLILRKELSGSSKEKVHRFRGWIVLDISENREETSVSAVAVNARGFETRGTVGELVEDQVMEGLVD